MKLPSWSGTVLHALGGLVIAIALTAIGIPGLLVLIVLTLFGWAREVVQHDSELSLHQWIEALSWGLGAALGWAVVYNF